MQNRIWTSTLLVLAIFSTPAQAGLHRVRLTASEVTEGIFRGGKPTAEQISELRQFNIRTVINLQGGDLNNRLWAPIIRRWEPGEIPESIQRERELVEEYGMNFLSIPVNSLKPFTDKESRDVDVALEAMGDPDARPIYIHCEYGRDRTGLLIALYKVKYMDWAPIDAYREWLRMGHSRVARVFTGSLDEFYFRKVAEN